MTNPIIRIHNVESNEIIDRKMTNEEFADYNARKTEQEIAQAEIESKAVARQAILDKLGLTVDEAKLLLG